MPGLDQALQQLISPIGLLLVLIGTALGITVGAIPGLTGAMLIALTLPLTFTMVPEQAMILLVSMYVGAISGGLITATLLRMPGTPASIMTTLDGYPMAKSGRPGRALGLGITASFVGGLISFAFLILLSKPMAAFSTKLGPFEFFSLVLMALVLIASIGGRSLTRSLLSGFAGILAAMPGIAASTGQARMTFGVTQMNDGFKLLPVLIGLFAISQIIKDVLNIDERGDRVVMSRRGLWLSGKDWAAQWFNMLRSSVIGTWIGILPGIGANIGSVSAYSTAKSFSKTPNEFGSGSDEGIVASESANNATVGGALIPLVSMGIPGSVIDAILLGAMVIHGLRPGPLLFEQSPAIVYTIMGTYLAANIAMVVIMIGSVGWLAKLADLPRALLLPVILAFCVIGSYALSNRLFDVWVMLGFGLLGFIMERHKIPLAPFVIGFVLGPIAEEKLSAGLMSSGGSFWPIVERPISATFFILSILLLAMPLIRRYRSAKVEAETS
jgi:putative tricarboxylic transport membrane protein